MEPIASERQSMLMPPRRLSPRPLPCGAGLVVSCALLAAGRAQDPPPHVTGGDGHAHASLPPIEIGLGLLAAVGASTASDRELEDLAGGAHDPAQRGFTFRQAELSLRGELLPWLSGRAILVAAIEAGDGETVVELEEAFVSTRGLPWGLEAKAGTFFTEFGLANATHPHAQDWQNQPVMMTRVFGGDGMRGPGARVAWCTGALAASCTVQNAHGETMPSFLASEEVYAERPIGGRAFTAQEVHSLADLLWSGRAALQLVDRPAAELAVGVSGAFGPNATGNAADTVLWGLDVAWGAGRPAVGCRAFAAWSLQGEWLRRDFDAAPQVDASDPLAVVSLPATTLRDQGGYLQALVACSDLVAVGLRGEYATGSGDSYRGGGVFARAEDPYRADRLRISPLLAWRPSPGTGVTLQYDYDDSDHLDGSRHSFWIGMQVMLGAHAAHAAHSADVD